MENESYLTGIGIGGIRTFDAYQSFDLAPITLLVGPNSSGKSTLVKTLLLLQESMRRHGLRRLDFDRGEHRLGSYERALARGRKERGDETIEYSLRLANALGKTFPLTPPHFDDEAYEQYGDGSKPHEIPCEWPEETEIRIRMRDREMPAFSLVSGTGKEVVEWFSIRDKESGTRGFPDPDDGPDFEIDYFDIEMRVDAGWLLNRVDHDDGKFMRLHPGDDPSLFIDKLRDGIALSQDWPEEDVSGWISASYLAGFELGSSSFKNMERRLQLFLYFTVGTLLERILEAAGSALGAIQYSGTFALQPQRIYTSDHLSESAVELLRQYAARSRAPGNTFVDAWSRRLGIGDGVRVQEVVEGAFVIDVKRGDAHVGLQDIGRGHAQLVTTLLMLAVGHHGTHRDMILLEEPEANLHPNLHTRIADLLAAVTVDGPAGNMLLLHTSAGESYSDGVSYDDDLKRTNRVIVETHSEYLIRRLQVLVASGAVEPERVVIYHFGPDPAADDYVRQIKIAPNGQLTGDIGPAFLDEATGLMVDLYKHANPN